MKFDSEDMPEAQLVGQSAAMREVRAQAREAAQSGSTVLISGETGTGKGVVARSIHALACASRPFVHVDCASLSMGTFESELFGHERGAFTDARERRVGRFELAESGTLFLDEIGELEGRWQAKFLRVLQDRAFERVGGNQSVALRARVIAASNRDLARQVESGAFRADLYYRLEVLRIHVPPLRERLDDLALLARSGVSRVCRALGRVEPRLTALFLDRLAEHDWPGNVRELLNVLERCLVRERGSELCVRHLERVLSCESRSKDPSRAHRSEPSGRLAVVARDRDDSSCDPDRIGATLRETGGNVSRAARRLGVSRSTLRYRIDRYGLSPCVLRD